MKSHLSRLYKEKQMTIDYENCPTVINDLCKLEAKSLANQ